MRTKIRIKPIHFWLLLNVLVVTNSFAQQIPLVYEIENSGVSCAQPLLPNPGNLVNYPLLPDPFAWSDGSGRVEKFTDWECRRNEIKAEIEKYEIGPKPSRPENITATFANNTLTVVVTENGQTLTLTSTVTIPAGDGPFPVIIGMNSGTGSLPSGLFNNAIKIPFMHNQVVTYSQTSTKNPADPYYKLYPDLTYIGNYSAWAWGVSRLIDGIEIVRSALKADTKRMAVTGCSYAGKMALFSGAYDERIALTIVQESGGGGINSWRVSETIGEVEKIDNTNYSWFMPSLKTNFQGKVGTLPYDHHELMAMIVPRALLVLGNPPFVWLGDESGYVSCRAAEEVYKTFGIPERFGFSFRSGHDHCSLPAESYSEVQAFINKFLFYDNAVNTNIRVHDFYNVDYNKWIKAWSSPANPNTPTITISSPQNGTTLDAPATITFTTTVTDPNNDVVKVTFYNKNQLLGEDTEAPYSLTLTEMTPGTYNISAEVIDIENLKGYSNVVSVTVKAPTLSIYKTSTPPVIDGIIDNIWTNEKVVSFVATNKLVGTDFTDSDLSGRAKILWDDIYVYLLAEVTDDVKMNDSPNTYEDDNVEFYFDINNAKSATYDANDVQYSFAWNDGTTIGVIPSSRSRTGITYNVANTGTGYVIEARILWTTLLGPPTGNRTMGFDFMINDDDNGAGRDGKLSWNAAADQAWQNASYFGTVLLKDNEVLVSINDPKELGSVSIFPNPAKKKLFVEGIDKEFEYQIVDFTGKLLLSGRSKNDIPIDNLSIGFYILNITDGIKITNLKFIKD